MKHFLTIGALSLGLLLTACEKADNDEDNVSAQDRNFVAEMTLSNRTEIALSNMALNMATNDSVRQFAQQMITEHTAADAQLADIADDLDIDLPADSLNAMGTTMRTTLMGLSGRAFDSAYITGQVPAHQASLAIAQTEINAGTSGQLRTFATDMAPKIQMHLAMADSISTRFR
ncbi:putative membrane protein [Cnuella takakiae]|uniref:Putative membrane protein n=1 Tax=Cnuella takakiae TaxID=1302690 RepID=A0A1M5GFT0_9BACT|nr:DUF4142 domain-containing protein [Cnuella takakiae]OLY92398.1 hypothetical protein BUE76_11225 [Cnuella takakiae]SHG02371.1 putative membrane protein [Cnuella takakiae]